MEREIRYAVNWRIDDAGLRFIADREAEGGAILHAYDDADHQARPIKQGDPIHGTLTIGYGHIRDVKPGMRITDKEALELLRTDIREAESFVHRFVRVPVTQWQYNALVSIVFNVGPGRLPGSTGPDDKGKSGIIVLTTGKPSSLLNALNEGKYDVAATWFTAWKATKGFEFGLFRRRIAEMLMFMGLPWTRAYLACKSLQFTMAEAIRLGKEELADIQGVSPPAPPPIVTVITDVAKSPPRVEVAPAPIQDSPLPDLASQATILKGELRIPLPGEFGGEELVLNRPAATEASTEANGTASAPEATQPVPAQTRVPQTDSNPAVSPAGSAERPDPIAPSPPVVLPSPLPPLPPLAKPSNVPAPRPFDPPVIAGQGGVKPMHPETKMPDMIPYRIDPNAGAKPLESTERFLGSVFILLGTLTRTAMANGFKLSGAGGVIVAWILTLMKDPVHFAIFVAFCAMGITGALWVFGVCLQKFGVKKKRKGEAGSSQLMY